MVKAIETVYKGYKFRSRLEARWAVLFDELKIDYEYETEGFELEDGTRYLPDFYLPQYDWYVEVKPPRETASEEIERASRLIDGNKIKAILLLGNIPPEKPLAAWHYIVLWHSFIQQEVQTQSVLLTANYGIGAFITWLGVDNISGNDVRKRRTGLNIYMVKNDIKRVLTAVHENELSEIIHYVDEVLEEWEKDVLNSAYKKAREARFEYGEKPEV